MKRRNAIKIIGGITIVPSLANAQDFLEQMQLIANLKNFNKFFNNVYRCDLTMKGLNKKGLERRVRVSGTAFNYKDKDKSFYITAKHIVIPTSEDLDRSELTYIHLDTLKLFDYQNNELNAQVISQSIKHDLATLVSERDKIRSKIDLIQTDDLRNGEEVYVVGYPNLCRIIKKSNIAAITQENIILDELVSAGFSGAPVFAIRYNTLKLAGIVSKIYPSKHLTMAIPSDYFPDFLERKSHNYEEREDYCTPLFYKK